MCTTERAIWPVEDSSVPNRQSMRSRRWLCTIEIASVPVDDTRCMASWQVEDGSVPKGGPIGL